MRKVIDYPFPPKKAINSCIKSGFQEMIIWAFPYNKKIRIAVFSCCINGKDDNRLLAVTPSYCPGEHATMCVQVRKTLKTRMAAFQAITGFFF